MNPDCHCEQALLAVPGIAELLDGLAVYTQNHFARLGRLQRSAYLLDYTLASMNTLLPPSSGDTGATAAVDAAGASSSGGGPDGYPASAPLEAEGQDGATPAAAAMDGQPSPATLLQLEGSVEAAEEGVHPVRTAAAGAAEASTVSNGVEGTAADGKPSPNGTAGSTPAHTAQDADKQQTGTGKRRRAPAKSKRRSAGGNLESNGTSATGSKGKKAKQTKT